MIETRCAVIDLSSIVCNVIIAIPTDIPPLDCRLVEIMNGQSCDIGWLWDGTNFINPLNSSGEVID